MKCCVCISCQSDLCGKKKGKLKKRAKDEKCKHEFIDARK